MFVSFFNTGNRLGKQVRCQVLCVGVSDQCSKFYSDSYIYIKRYKQSTVCQII
jgi:hypothetical protein